MNVPAPLAPLLLALALAACQGDPAPVPTPVPSETPSPSPTPTASPTPAADMRELYRNDRFNFAIRVPQGFAADPATASEDGRVFRNGPASLAVFGGTAPQQSFDDQISIASDGLIELDARQSDRHSWRATGLTEQGDRVHVLMVRKPDGSTITARFRYPRPLAADLNQIARDTLDSLRGVMAEGAATLLYDPATLVVVPSTLALPGTDQTIPARKLIAYNRLPLMGQRVCRYGLTGLTTECNPQQEAGVALAQTDVAMADLRRSFAGSGFESVLIDGQLGVRTTAQTGGEGAGTTLVPLETRTLVVSRRFRSLRDGPADAIDDAADSLMLATQPAADAAGTAPSGG